MPMRAAAVAMLIAGLAGGPAAAMQLTSRDVSADAAMPTAQIYPRCGGANISPELSWSGAPRATRSFAVTMIDLSVKPADWSHWIVVDLPPTTTALARGAGRLPAGARAVVNNFGQAAYDGPCPPAGSGTHRYRITVWALPAASIRVAPDAPASQVLALLARQAIGQASLTATAQR